MKFSFPLALMLLAASTQTLMAVQARRDVITTVTQPDGTELSLTLIGDERAHCYLTTDGLPVLQDASGRYCYASISSTGKAVASDMVARNVAQRTALDKAFVAKINPSQVRKAVFANSKSMPLRANQSTSVGAKSSNIPHMGDVHALVLLVAFQDQAFSMDDPLDYYKDFLNGENFTRDGGTGSCRQYFIDSSYGQFSPTFDVHGPVTLGHDESYYGANGDNGSDANAYQMVIDACSALDSEIDFSAYDSDADGYVDNVYVIYAGLGEATGGASTTIWPHQWNIIATGVRYEFDDKILSSYGCCNETSDGKPMGIGTFCHEFSHVLGLPDLYDTTYGEARTVTPGNWSLMDSGNYNNDNRTPCAYSSYERNAMGWVDPVVLKDDGASLELSNLLDSNKCAEVLTPSRSEFFLIENRQQTGWDKYLPGHGMLVWHVDYDRTNWVYATVNNDISHQYVDLIEANGEANNRNSETLAGYAFPGTSANRSISEETEPSLKTWTGAVHGVSIDDITETDGVVSFNVSNTATEAQFSIGDLVGHYQLSYQGILTTDTKDQRTTVNFDIVAASDNQIIITGLFARDVTATVDLVAGTISIASPYTLYTSNGNDVSAIHYIMGSSTVEQLDEPIVALFNSDTGELIFDQNDYIGVGVVGANLWSKMMSQIQAQKIDGDYTTADGWIDMDGAATFIDGWIMPRFKDSSKNVLLGSDYPVEVAVQRKADDVNIFRLVNPYAEAKPITGSNKDANAAGYIVLDVTDPEFVIVKNAVYCGYTLIDRAVYPYNLAGYYVNVLGQDKATVKANYADGSIIYDSSAAKASTYADNVVTINDPVVGMTNMIDYSANWSNGQTPIITLPNNATSSVLDVDVDAAPCEYFNLQGIRVDNPAHGQIYIRRQGNTATKVIF